MPESNIIMEIKKEHLKRHLDEVENLLGEWRHQLYAPAPFKVSETDARTVIYTPPLERDPDNNHILHRHVKSRMFWRHHSDWERKLRAIHQEADELLKLGTGYVEQLADRMPQIQPTAMFIRVALDDAFTWSSHKKISKKYEPVREGVGVWCGGIRIEEASTNEEVWLVQEAHHRLIVELRNSEAMTGIVGYWKDAKGSETRMIKLLSDVLKSGDFLYPCRFCRKLFKA